MYYSIHLLFFPIANLSPFKKFGLNIVHIHQIKKKMKCLVHGAYGQCLLMLKHFCAVYDYAGKVDLSKGYGNPKRKLSVTMQFLEIIKQQLFRKAVKCTPMYGIFLPN